MAGLIITPAIVVQAGDVQASETATPINVTASVTAKDLLDSFKEANENLDAPDIALERIKYKNLLEGNKADLTKPELDLIDAKITYLESYIEFIEKANDLKNKIEKLTYTNGNLISDTDVAQMLYEDLVNDQIEASKKLSIFASNAGERAINLLDSLQYYEEDEATNFIQPVIVKNGVNELDKNIEIVKYLKEVIDETIVPIQNASKAEPIVKDTYVSAVDNAQTVFNEISDTTFEGIEGEALKNVLKIQVVENGVNFEQFIKNAVINITKAESIEAKIQDVQDNPPTGTTLNSKITAITNEYKKLDPLQKALVSNYDQMKSYNKVVEVVQEITDLTKLATNTKELREKLPEVETSFKALNPIEVDLVTNATKLVEIRATVDKVEDVEDLITSITIANIEEATRKARTAYNALSSGERRYVLKEALDLLTSWEKSSSTAANVMKQIDAITTDAFVSLDDEKLADSRKLSTVTGFVKKVRTAESSYAKIKGEEGAEETDQQKLVTNRKRLEALIPIATIADNISTLKVTSATYTEDLAAATTALSNWPEDTAIPADEQQNIAKLKVFLEAYLKAQQNEQAVAVKLDEEITALQTASPVNLEQMTTARATYNSLSSSGKRLVKNSKELSNLERQYKAALNTVKTIDAIEVKKDKAGKKVMDEKGLKDFARKTTAAKTSYDKLTKPMQDVVYNSSKLDALLPFAQLIIDIDAIRPTAKDFKEKLAKAQSEFDTLFKDYSVPADLTEDFDLIQAKLYEVYRDKLEVNEQLVTSAAKIETRIDALKSKIGEAFITDLSEVSTAYKQLDSATKRNVSNAKILTELERDYKASLRVIEQINKLPAHTERSFTSKVASAQKAYDRLTEKQKNDVYNYESNLKNVLKVADLIGRIDKLRVSSKTYEVDVAAIRTEFNALSAAEKEQVHNITKLDSAEGGVSDAQGVIALIDAAIPTAEDYIQKLIDARQGYDSLSRDNQRLVTNYKDLQNRERTVKPVLKLDTDILALDPSNARTFISKYKSAEKAYEKLSISDRALLVNTEMFLGDFKSIYQVVNAINSVKPSSKTFVEDTQAARALYNALPVNLASQVSNLSTLQDHELNVQGGATVDAMIRSLNSAPANEFVAKVKEAREAYKALSSANKKAVTLESELKEQEKYIKPIEAAIKAIDGLSNPRNDLSRQFNTVNNALKKLDDKQKEYVTNMDQYSNLSNVIHVYTLINGLKPNDRYYQGNMEAAKLAYDKLSEEEKLKVTNYYKLQQAVLDMTEVQKVTTIIASLNASSSNFEADVQKALAEYKALPSGSKRQVLNYSVLQQAERDLKAAQRVIKQIDDLDSTLRSYESKAKSAKSSYDRLTVDQKALVKNYNKLQAAVFELGL